VAAHIKGAKMATIILAVALTGFALLFVATVTLVTLNWSEKTLAPVLSILLVGTATTLAAVLVTLKESTVESAFSTSVVLDTNEGAPLFLIPDQSNPKLTARLSELARLGRPAVNREGKTIVTNQKPANEGESFRLCGELLQYQLLHAIEKLQRGGWKAGMFFGSSMATINNPLKSANSFNYPNDELLAAVAGNRFSDSDNERFWWQHSRFPLPTKAKLSLIYLPPSAGTEKHIVRLEKPMYFEVEFVVEPLLGTGLGPLPKGLTVAPEIAAHCQTYQFRITMRAKFEKITAGSSLTQEYKDWTKRLFSGLQDDLGD